MISKKAFVIEHYFTLILSDKTKYDTLLALCLEPHSTVILREYFENITLKSCSIARIFNLPEDLNVHVNEISEKLTTIELNKL